jgi:hypothetical protein
MPKLKRGKKSDWLYEQVSSLGLFIKIVRALDMPHGLAEKLESNDDHEERAALICLLTAAAVDRGFYTAVGEQEGGYFFLPPWNLWNEWARRELDMQRKRIDNVEVWMNGKKYKTDESLP